MTETASPPRPAETFDSLGAIDALEASGFARAQAAALSQQLLIAVNTPSPKIEEELDELIAVVGKTIRQVRVLTGGFTLLNLAILASILLTLSS